MDSATPQPASRVPMAMGIAAVVVWAHYLPSVWPLPPRSNLPVDLQWSLWWESLFLTALGLAAAALAIRAARFWQVALLVTSGFMVVSSIPAIVADLMEATTFAVWFGWFRGARTSSLYYLLVVPLYHVAIVVAVAAHALLTLGDRPHGQRNAA